MKYLLFIFIYLSFYVIKGFIARKQPVSSILFLTVCSLWYAMYTIALGFYGTLELVAKILLVYSLVIYVLRLLKVKLPVTPFFSLFEVNHGAFELRYLVFKPGFLLLTNIYCFIKHFPLVSLSDVIEVDVKIADKQIVMVKL